MMSNAKLRRSNADEVIGKKEGFFVMIVEDSDDQAEYLAEILRSNNFDVITLQNGMKALEWILTNRRKPDVIVTDVMMPSLNGFELLKKMKFLNIKIPTLIVSGNKSTKFFRRGLCSWSSRVSCKTHFSIRAGGKSGKNTFGGLKVLFKSFHRIQKLGEFL